MPMRRDFFFSGVECHGGRVEHGIERRNNVDTRERANFLSMIKEMGDGKGKCSLKLQRKHNLRFREE